MSRIQYLVTEYQGLWFVLLQGKRHGPYPSQQAAVDDAVRGAKTVPGAEVLLQVNDNQARMVWSDGSDGSDLQHNPPRA